MAEPNPITAYCLLVTDANVRDALMIGGYILRPAGRKKNRLEAVEGGRFSRPASQTESIDHMEYEALIAGLMLARELGIERIWAYTDRRSIVEQYYQCPRKPAETSRANLETVVGLRASFKGFGMSWIPRAFNLEADALARPQ
jgi:ribonuclease HI